MDKTLIVMRGLPWCGKSFRAKQLVEEAAANGVTGQIFSTDEFWYKIRKPDQPDHYSFNPRYLGEAHKWNQLRAQRRIDMGDELLLIDNTNVTGTDAKAYVEYAFYQDYKICIEEPTSERWLEIRELLKDKRKNKKELKEWAKKLAEGSKETHSVPQWSIERMMWRWENDLTVEQIMASESRTEE